MEDTESQRETNLLSQNERNSLHRVVESSEEVGGRMQAERTRSSAEDQRQGRFWILRYRFAARSANTGKVSDSQG